MTNRDAPLSLFVDHVTHIDCGVVDPECGLRGATWLVDAVMTGRRGADGMLFDFGPAKRLLKQSIDALVDHRLLVPARAPGIHIDGDTVEWATTSGERYRYTGPESAITRLEMEAIAPTPLARWLEARVAPQLPANVHGLSLDLRAEPVDGPVYDYTHGLAHHDGNCQRLAHGHRCRLAIAIDGVDRPDIARAWAEQWQGIFIGSRSDLAGKAGRGRLRFAYTAEQGAFELDIAAEHCVLLDAPATVENIAEHVAEVLAARHAGRQIHVRAYEGVGKGAIASRGPHAATSDGTEDINPHANRGGRP